MSNFKSQIPHLQIAKNANLGDFEENFINNQVKIEAWFRKQWLNTPSLITASVDIRNAGNKVAPVDTNIYPAGFNNLNPDFFPLCIQAAQNALSERYPTCKKILIIPENHTRNPFYFESLNVLAHIFEKAGSEVKIGSLLPINKSKVIELKSGSTITLEPLIREDNRLKLKNYDPNLIILNNDLSEGTPDILKGLEQPIEPPTKLGWHSRSKIKHFKYYEQVATNFAQLINIDPWHIVPITSYCGKINFVTNENQDCLVEKAKTLFYQVQEKYNKLNIKEPPFIVIKAAAGTYGIAVMPVRSIDELISLNRKQKNKMSKSKGGQVVTSVILQEGIYTQETVGNDLHVAEPVIYLLGHNVVGGFYRVHKNRGQFENLNAPGMHFEPLAFAKCCNNPDKRLGCFDAQNQFYVYSVIARLAVLATCHELIEMHNKE